MSYILHNALPIALATLAGLLVTLLAYRQAKVGTLLVNAVAQAWLAAILAGALILAPRQAGIWTMTLGSAVVIWIGFVLPTLVGSGALRGRRWRDGLGDAGLWLAIMLTQAVVLRLVGVSLRN